MRSATRTHASSRRFAAKHRAPIHFSNLYHNALSGSAGAQARRMVRPRSRFFLQQRHRSHRGRAEAGAPLRPHSRTNPPTQPCEEASHPGDGRIPFTAAPLAPSASPPRKNIACPSRRSFPASNLCASTMSPTSNRNSTTPSAPSCSKRFRAKAAFIPSTEAFWDRARALDHATRRGADRRRNSVRAGPHRPLLRLSETSRRSPTSR